MTARGPKQPPADQAARTRFIHELERNFSVLAPAGVGKTKSLVDRVVAIATGDPERAKAWLPRLVVVTYTNKAADEMYQRARNAIIEQKVGLPILTQFNHAFFGTLHSFCVRLLQTHGHRCGLPAQFEPVEDDEEVWREFIRQSDRLAPHTPPVLLDQVTRLVPMDDLLKLARKVRPDSFRLLEQAVPPAPAVDLRGLLGIEGDKRSAAGIERSQRMAREWLAAWTQGDRYAPLPAKPATAAKAFVESWRNAFAPLRAWMGPAALRVAVELAAAYRDYRRQRGILTFDDQVELAWTLVRDPGAGRRLREQGYRIILDEAQDTDPLQFGILLELARPVSASGVWMESGWAAPEPGRFCMVGDPQQSIYGDRADLGFYQQVRHQLAEARAADELVFTVTFRCDHAVVDSVNALVQPMFARSEGQVTYTPLTARPGAGPGQVVRWSPANVDPRVGVDERSVQEGRELARWLKAQGLARLGATDWSQVAVLCPRTRWLQALAAAFRAEGLLPQVHSNRSVQADDPAYAWFTALLTILARPQDGFEVVGVLREIYGLPDADLARHARGDGAVWDLSRTVEPGDDVTRVLHQLGDLVRRVEGLPLRDAARLAVATTGLRDRLAQLPEDRAALEETLEKLLVRAAMAEDQGLSLAEFARVLREGMNDKVEARPVNREAIQLLTSYKAKGLQWEAVILPLMFRSIGDNKNFPALLHGRPGTPPQVAFAAHDMAEAREQVELRKRQELQRLLYVALTRARQTLVVVDDYAAFKARKPNQSQADLLGMLDTAGNRIANEAWNGLPEDLRMVPGHREETPAPPEEPMDSLSATLVEAALHCAQAIPRRILPYQLGEAEARAERGLTEPETNRSIAAETARAYGIWWHETIEHLDWPGGPESWRAHWQAALPTCPDPARGQREGEALFRSELAHRLAQPGLVVHREMPMLWRRSDRACVEGIMDLAAWDASRKRWLVVDWKTNRVDETGHKHLRQIYEPQLRAYAEALREISGAPVEAGVHATATGGWVPCATIP